MPAPHRQSGKVGARSVTQKTLSASYLDFCKTALMTAPGTNGTCRPRRSMSAVHFSVSSAIKPRLHLGIGKSGVDLPVELVDNLGGSGLGHADAIPGTAYAAGQGSRCRSDLFRPSPCFCSQSSTSAAMASLLSSAMRA